LRNIIRGNAKEAQKSSVLKALTHGYAAMLGVDEAIIGPIFSEKYSSAVSASSPAAVPGRNETSSREGERGNGRGFASTIS
jgi:hypothetical protein